MTSLTLFSAPKPFADPLIATIQRNALASWSRLGGANIILMGSGYGVAEAAREYGALHLPEVRTNDSGTPLISSMMELAGQHGRGELLGIINADMIVMNDLVEAAELVSSRLREYVLVGRRWDLSVESPLDFSRGWEQRLRAAVVEEGSLHNPTGSDCFVFPRGVYVDVPDFAVGRAGWDNWMIAAARQERVPVIDCTLSVMLVHQNHDYGHLPGGVPHYALPESHENIRLAGGTAMIRYTVLDATHCLVDGNLIRPPISAARMLRAVELFLRRALFFLPPHRLEAAVRPKRWRRVWARLTRRFWREPGGHDA